jgi:hypothetical protein
MQMAKSKGWYTLSRSVHDSEIWNADEPFDKRSAYIDLLLMANYEEKKFIPRHSNDVITIHVGQLATSVRSLRQRWKWGDKKVTAYLNQLKLLGLVKLKGYSWGTLITLVEYGKSGNRGNTSDDTSDDTNDDATDDTNGRAVDDTTDDRNGRRLKEVKEDNKDEITKEIKQSAKRSGFCLWEGEPE